MPTTLREDGCFVAQRDRRGAFNSLR